jgi:hypothetical protein
MQLGKSMERLAVAPNENDVTPRLVAEGDEEEQS